MALKNDEIKYFEENKKNKSISDVVVSIKNMVQQLEDKINIDNLNNISQEKLNNFFELLERQKIQITDKESLIIFFNRFPDSINQIETILPKLKETFNNHEIILEVEENSDLYINFCVRHNNYDDELFFKALNQLGDDTCNMLGNKKCEFNILIYTDFKKTKSQNND